MSDEKTRIKVGVANKGESSLLVEEIKEWKVKNRIYVRDAVYVITEDGVFSMKIKDFEEIFGDEYN